jgi:hypothetical protein
MFSIEAIKQAFQALFASQDQEVAATAESEQHYGDIEYTDEDAYIIAMMHWHGYYF